MTGIRRFAVLAAAAALLALPATPADAMTPMGASGAPTTDLDAPVIAWQASSVAVKRARLDMSWSAMDAASGVSGTDVRWRSKPVGGSFGRWHAPSAWQGLPATSEISKRIVQGRVYRFQVRAHDVAGNVSGWEALGGGMLSRTR